MDTHMTHLEPEAVIARTARLPDEPDLDGSPAPAAPRATPQGRAGADPAEPGRPRARRRRVRLLAGVALGVLIVVGSGAFLLSPFNTVVPVPPAVVSLAGEAREAITHGVAQLQRQFAAPAAAPGARPSKRPAVAVPRDPVVAPAASLAATDLKPRPESVVASRYTPRPAEQSIDEVLALGAAKPDPAKPSSPAKLGEKPNAVALKPVAAAPAPVPSPDAPADVREPGADGPPLQEVKPAPVERAAVTPQAPLGPPSPAVVALLAKPTEPAPAAPPDITTAVTQAALASPPAAVSSPDGAPTAPPTAAPPTASPQSSLPPAATVTVRSGAAASPAATSAAASPFDASGSKPEPAKPVTLVLSVPSDHQEQAEVLQFVTGLTSEITRLRVENESLRKDVGRRMAEQDGRLADFNRRVSVAEARAALRSVSDAGKPEDASAPAAPRPLPQNAGASAASTAAPPASQKRYRVQAASPGLALLAEIGRGGGEGAQLQVAVGDQVPGYGVVKSVSQRGPNWVVQTERGAID